MIGQPILVPPEPIRDETRRVPTYRRFQVQPPGSHPGDKCAHHPSRGGRRAENPHPLPATQAQPTTKPTLHPETRTGCQSPPTADTTRGKTSPTDLALPRNCGAKTTECSYPCLLYTSDAADDLLCVDLGGRRIIKKKKQKNTI